MLIAIAAMTHDRVIGQDNKIPRDIPEDLARFREITSGKTVVMGRKTYESIGRLLPKRHNIIISSTLTDLPPRTNNETTGEIIKNIEDFLTRYDAHRDETVYIIGGGQIYTSLLPHCDQLDITEIKDNYTGDAYFPAFKDRFTELAREANDGYDFVKYEKKQ